MRLAFVNRFYAPDHSATSQLLTDLAVALAAGGAEVHVVTSRLRYDDPAARLPPREDIDGVHVHRVRTTSFGRATLVGRGFDYLSFYVTAIFEVFRVIRKGDVVVAKTDPPLISVPVRWVAGFRDARVVNWLQDVFPEAAGALGLGLGRGIFGRLLSWFRNESLRRASANVVLGRLMCDRVVALGVDPGRVVVIPNWADGSAIEPVPAASNPLRAEWRLGGKFVVGYSGNMGRAHEFETILDAAMALRDDPEVVFLFIGGGAQRAMIAEASAARGLGNLVFKPYQPRERLAQSLSAADAHLVSLQPSLEGLIVPSKFYGIAAAGRPTIFVGDLNGEIATELRSSESGFSVRPGDVGELVAAIRALRGDDNLRDRMGRNARRVFEARFDKPIAVERWRRLLGDVAEGRAVGQA
ncbi:MAG: glycosyltransferase family 4 protein [Burkholderiales bacterium]|nr:glycosyltransferase family 4 protein [Burkholderiales bacterium]